MQCSNTQACKKCSHHLSFSVLQVYSEVTEEEEEKQEEEEVTIV